MSEVTELPRARRQTPACSIRDSQLARLRAMLRDRQQMADTASCPHVAADYALDAQALAAGIAAIEATSARPFDPFRGSE